MEAREVLPIADASRTRGYNATVEPPAVGALRAWDASNESILCACHVSSCNAKLMQCLIASNTIQRSGDIHVEHVMGQCQYVDPTRLLAGSNSAGTT